jgi:hypothetical protein
VEGRTFEATGGRVSRHECSEESPEARPKLGVSPDPMEIHQGHRESLPVQGEGMDIDAIVVAILWHCLDPVNHGAERTQVRSAKLLRTSGFCPHAYRAAVWPSRQNLLGLRRSWQREFAKRKLCN